MNAQFFVSRALSGLLVLATFSFGGCTIVQKNPDGSGTEVRILDPGPDTRVMVDPYDYRYNRYRGPVIGVAVPPVIGVARPRLNQPPVYCRPDNPYYRDPRRCRR